MHSLRGPLPHFMTSTCNGYLKLTLCLNVPCRPSVCGRGCSPSALFPPSCFQLAGMGSSYTLANNRRSRALDPLIYSHMQDSLTYVDSEPVAGFKLGPSATVEHLPINIRNLLGSLAVVFVDKKGTTIPL